MNYFRPTMVELKEITGAIKDIATTLAFLGGGIWAVFKFLAERRQDKQNKQAVIDISVEAEHESPAENEGGSCAVSAAAVIVNRGTQNAFLDFQTVPPFLISRVTFGASGVGAEQPLLQASISYADMVLRVGATQRFPIFFQAPSYGVYNIGFRVTVSEKDLHAYKQAGGLRNKGDKILWVGSTHLTIQKSTGQEANS